MASNERQYARHKNRSIDPIRALYAFYKILENSFCEHR